MYRVRKYCVEYDGIKFYGDESHYFYSSKAGKLHRYIWTKEIGIIPKGHVIHHIDWNIMNNQISNLMCLTIKEHIRLHQKGIPKSEEHCQNLSKSQKGNTPWNKGKSGLYKQTDKWKENNSKMMKEKWSDPEFLEKMKEKHRKHQEGDIWENSAGWFFCKDGKGNYIPKKDYSKYDIK
jgi:hypothetical protein